MTRINVAIPPKLLTDKHLLAEHREIKRIPNALSKYGKDLNLKNIPGKFTLGTGHVRFFYDKGAYTFHRYLNIYSECKARGFNITNYAEAWDVYIDYPHLYNDYAETQADHNLLRDRLIERDASYKQILL